ncbi:MAG: DegV family protein [Chloroflexi bacterium]|nr:DegV family protein [Chloroflexota bacterium]
MGEGDRLKIVTDSTCDMPEAWQREHGIHVVPINIQFGMETYAEGMTIDDQAFYQRIAESKVFPQTSQPSVGAFVETYRRLGQDGSHILSIHVTGKLSGTCQSAELAKREVGDAIQVRVFDSLCGSAGMGFMCVEAARMARRGADEEEILRRLEEIRSRINIFLTPANLEYLKMSGRVKGLQAVLGSLLNVKPIIALNQGLLEPAGRARSRSKALEQLLERTQQAVGDRPLNLAVVHSRAPEEAQELYQRTLANLNVRESFVDDFAISLAVHFGPGTIALISYPV